MEHTDARLSALLRVLTNSPRPEVVARALALGAFQPFDVRQLTLHAVLGEQLELRSAHGWTSAQQRMTSRIPLSADTPESRAVLRLQHIAVDDLSTERDIALLAHHNPAAGGSLLCEPLLHEARAIGVLSLRFAPTDEPVALPMHLLDGVAAAVTLWLLTDARTAPAPAHAAQLRVTPRQQHVLEGLRRDLTNAAIATELGFAIGTIKADITALNALFGATGREDLVRKAERAGF